MQSSTNSTGLVNGRPTLSLATRAACVDSPTGGSTDTAGTRDEQAKESADPRPMSGRELEDSRRAHRVGPRSAVGAGATRTTLHTTVATAPARTMTLPHASALSGPRARRRHRGRTLAPNTAPPGTALQVTTARPTATIAGFISSVSRRPGDLGENLPDLLDKTGYVDEQTGAKRSEEVDKLVAELSKWASEGELDAAIASEAVRVLEANRNG